MQDPWHTLVVVSTLLLLFSAVLMQMRKGLLLWLNTRS